ncbi:DUF748 domain-containing protein [Fodinibius halophilus]|uniref:DUF748 domain-containing protein n=1 Tax=Fodinibius halophilus TaxID=1736908 RepID=A0A6M1T826_9BACT|nr:DUF748 domain-containing protein [Fodinibius halophilus]NGP88131.1 DUF748 domain-containing protein [Fodinibius halophilus]
MKRYQKVLLGILTAIIILIGGIQIYFSFFMDAQLKQTIISRFQESAGNTFTLTINDLDLELLGRGINISGVTLSSKKQEYQSELQSTIEDIHIRGINFWQLFIHQNIKLKEIRIVNPDISLTGTSSSTSSTFNRENIRNQLSKIDLLQQLSIPKFSITGLSFNYTHKDEQSSPTLSFRDSDIHLYDISFDSTFFSEDKIIPAQHLTTDLRDLQYQTADGVYKLSTHQIAFSSMDSSMSIRSLQLQPRFSKATFPKQFNHEVDRIRIKVDQIYWSGIDSHKLNSKQQLSVQDILIRNPDFDIYRDKRPPFPPNNNPPLPQEVIQGIPFPITVDRITLSDGRIRYSEQIPQAQKAGYLLFTNLTGIFNNLSNIEKEWHDKSPSLQVKTDVMDSAELNASFRFPMDSKQQYISGHLSAMPMKPLNKALTPLAFTRIDKGQILGMDFNMTLSPNKAKGAMTFTYENLKISLLNKGEGQQNFGNTMKSFLANTFKVKTQNKGDDPRKGTIKFDRDTNKSVFNYWWKSLLSGLKSSIGI